MTRLSVLMPARNAADTITASLRSTLRALPPESEVLILDDGSIDGTGQRARGMGDRRVRVLRAESPSGVAKALNILLAEATGEYVARMDADDIVLPGRFRLQLARLTRQVDILFGGVIHFGANITIPRPSPPVAISPNAFPVALLIDNPVAHSTMLARRSALEGLGGYRNCLAEDYDLWLRAAAGGVQLARLSTPVTALRHHANQITANDGWAERAAAEQDWQISYSNLAATSGMVHADSSAIDQLKAAGSIREKRQLLRSAIVSSVAKMGWTDRVALQALMRRADDN